MNGARVHSLGTVLAALAAAAAIGSALIGARREKAAARRLRDALRARHRRRPRWRPPAGSGTRLRDWGPPVAAGLGAATLIGGVLGGLVGALTVLGVRKALRGRQKATEGPGADGTGSPAPDPAELPLCADLMAACLAAGASPGEAAGAVGRSLAGPIGDALIRVRAELRLGADPADCWRRFGRLPAAREMGRCLARASTTGSAPVAEMSRLAADYRAGYARSALGRARRAAVHATAPLGVCFLPAFLLVGVAPVVMSLAGGVLGRTG
ncbi:Type II secretion system (T2SS), protein F [Actinacidiphila alni]|uniref:Type II secretion system (T2SS), protein F n=1 Tax=Actinacidiphila alni TaxID=380248 RepID=A0A1I2KWW9_9ACTN|nr:type II secretion system F family protein [Actinacidiphila alni]SFF71425.1 Type II secretion system (T2SS), protein F [Actinacidiphila alni]